MSSKGIFTALSGAVAQSKRLDTIANNMANVNTTGFKKGEQTFAEYLTANEKVPDVIQVPRIPASVESFYDMQAGDRGYVDASGTFNDFSQGNLKPTGSTLDFGIEGEGFFEVLSPRGVRLTRNGSFKVSPKGQLVTKQGYPVLKGGDGEAEGRAINIENRNFTVSSQGEIYSGGQSVGKLSLVDINDKDALNKEGASLFGFKENMDPQIFPSSQSQIHQGFLEGSNVNIVDEMTNMIQASRAFESNQQVIKAYDQIDGKLVNDVAKT